MNNTTTKNVLLGIFFTGFAADIFYFPASSDIRYFILIFLWWTVTYTLRIRSEVTFKLALGLLGLLIIFFIFAKESGVMERIATWIYLLLVYGVVQQFLEIRKEKVSKN